MTYSTRPVDFTRVDRACKIVERALRKYTDGLDSGGRPVGFARIAWAETQPGDGVVEACEELLSYGRRLGTILEPMLKPRRARLLVRDVLAAIAQQGRLVEETAALNRWLIDWNNDHE